MIGNLRKMRATLSDEISHPVDYAIHLSHQGMDNYFSVTDQLGKKVDIIYSGQINCIHCGRKSNKSFAQGYCYPCFKSLAECDQCIVSPEKCHYLRGTCRDNDFAKTVCMQPHYVYLAKTSGVKVGITRETQVPTRWFDQGASQAILIAKVSQRYYSGLLEVLFKQQVSDRTAWQQMLKGNLSDDNLILARDQLFEQFALQISELQQQLGVENIKLLDNQTLVNIEYPVNKHPEKVKSLNLDKQKQVSGVLEGIKGQYLILDTGVINLRKYSGYQVELKIS